MKTTSFLVAALLSGCVHAAALGLLWLAASSPRRQDSLPALLVAYGDSDREGLPVDLVALEPGTLRQGNRHTPGGDGGPKVPAPKPPPPTPPPAPPPVVEQPIKPAPKPVEVPAAEKPAPEPPPPTPPPAPPPVVEQPIKPAPKPVEVPAAEKPAPEPPPPAPPVKPPAREKPARQAPPSPPPGPPRPAPKVTPGKHSRAARASGSSSGGPPLPGAPGGARLPLGTPSAGGRVGSRTGVRMAAGTRPPRYPPEAREAGLEGTPVIWLHISAEGAVLEARVHKSCGYRILDKAALNWARAQHYLPARRGGAPVEAEVTKPVRFYLY